jgi:hypothetical protein
MEIQAKAAISIPGLTLRLGEGKATPGSGPTAVDTPQQQALRPIKHQHRTFSSAMNAQQLLTFSLSCQSHCCTSHHHTRITRLLLPLQQPAGADGALLICVQYAVAHDWATGERSKNECNQHSPEKSVSQAGHI